MGDDVHLGARVAAAAHGGQVVLSSETAEQLESSDTASHGFLLSDLGEHRLKDIAEAVAIYQLGDRSFPPLKTISNTNLPRPASSFVGRDRELTEVLAHLERGARLVTLTGPGGSGKTRLAIEAAGTVVPEYKAGVFWVGLASLRDPALVSETVARTLGAKNGLAEHVGEREMLLLLDNLEQVIEAAPELASLLEACPNLTLLVTSRELLRVRGEVEYAVPPLSAREAVDLFCARSQLAHSDEIAELCLRLDSLPLAVELAAGRTKALTPARIVERLSQRLDLLEGGRDADPRQQTLRATIEWSYDLLAEEEQRLFRHLSVFAGGCTLEAAEEVCDADLNGLQSLVEKSLVRFTNERYWMLETIREYACERLEESSNGRAVKERHAERFAQLAVQAEAELDGSTQHHRLSELAVEHDNIRAALRTALDRTDRDADLALRLASSTATFWWVHGHWTEGRLWLGEALSQPFAQDRALRAKALVGASNLAVRQVDYLGAKDLAEEALTICRELNDASCIARALRVLALVAAGEQDNASFRILTQQSAAFAREAQDSWTLSMALNNLGYLALEADDLERAIALFAEAIDLARERADHRSESFFLQNLALANLERDMIEQASKDFAESLRLAHGLHFLEVLADDVAGVAAVAAARGDLETAARLLAGAGALREDFGEKSGSALDPIEARIEARTVAAIETGLDPEIRVAASHSGRNLRSDELVDLALAFLD